VETREIGFAVTTLDGTTWEPVGPPHDTHDQALKAARQHYYATSGYDEEPQFFDY